MTSIFVSRSVPVPIIAVLTLSGIWLATGSSPNAIAGEAGRAAIPIQHYMGAFPSLLEGRNVGAGVDVGTRAPIASECVDTARPYWLHVVRSPAEPWYGAHRVYNASPLDRRIWRQRPVGQLFRLLCRLPQFPSRIAVMCPNYYGAVYTLDFLRGRGMVLNATVTAGGCGTAVIGAEGEHPGSRRHATPRFWSLLAHMLRLPVPTLFPHI